MRRRIQRNIWIAAAIIGLLATVLVGAVRIHTLKREKETVQTRLKNEVQQGIAKELPPARGCQQRYGGGPEPEASR